MSHPTMNGSPAVPPTLPLVGSGYPHSTASSGSPLSHGSPSPVSSHLAGSSSNSYVVLGSHSSGARISNEYSMINHNHMASPVSLTDITLEQALSKVQELANENSSLREYLKENNDNMKRQFQMLTGWKAKVQESNQANLKKFEDYKATVQKLTQENQQLKDQVLQENQQHKDQTSSVSSGTDQVAVSDAPSSKSALLEDLQERIQRLTAESAAKASQVTELKQKVKELECQINNRSPEEETVFVSSTDGKDEIEKLTTNNAALEERCIELESKLENFRQQNEQLMLDLQEVQKLKQGLQTENSNLMQENLEAQKRMQSLLGDIKQVKHSVGGIPNVDSLKNYGYSMVEGKELDAEEKEAQLSVTAKQDIEILELQTATTNVGAGIPLKVERDTMEQFDMSEITTDLRDKLDEERKVTSQQKQIISEKDSEIARLEAKLKESDQMLSHYKEQVESQTASMKEQHYQQQQLLRQADVQSLKSQVLSLINEVRESSTKLDLTTKALEKKSALVVELEQHNHNLSENMQKQRSEADALITSLRTSLTSYEEALGKERGDHLITKRQLNELRASFNRLVTDYKELLDTFDNYKAQQQNLQMQSSQVPKGVMDEINRLTAQTIAAEEAITFRDEEIKKLKAENAKMKEEIDNTVPILKAQAEVWKQDFDAERQARERQHMEKENILQEMKNLEIQNQQLIDEIENQSRKSLAEMQRRHAPNPYQQQMQTHLQVGQGSPTGYQQQAAGYQQYPGQSKEHSPRDYQQPQVQSPRQQDHRAPPQPHSEEEEQPLTCPKCGISCPDLDTLQIHVIDCIDN